MVSLYGMGDFELDSLRRGKEGLWAMRIYRMKMKTLNAIEIGELKKLLDFYKEGYIACYEPEFTLLILDKDHKHVGSIALPTQIIIGMEG